MSRKICKAGDLARSGAWSVLGIGAILALAPKGGYRLLADFPYAYPEGLFWAYLLIALLSSFPLVMVLQDKVPSISRRSRTIAVVALLALLTISSACLYLVLYTLDAKSNT